MNKYFFYVFRFMPVSIREEFLNVGLILFHEENSYVLFINDFSRLNLLYPGKDINLVKDFCESLRFKRKIKMDELIESMPDIITLSPVKHGETDLNIKNVLYDLYLSIIKPLRG